MFLQMTQSEVISRTFRFVYNIPSNFIEEIWSDSPTLADHLKAKFTGFCRSEGYASANAILKFFASLDESNTEKFCIYASTWIQQHN
jgi:hypothetical protein